MKRDICDNAGSIYIEIEVYAVRIGLERCELEDYVTNYFIYVDKGYIYASRINLKIDTISVA